MHWKKLIPKVFHGKTVCSIEPSSMLSPQNNIHKEITDTLQGLSTDHEEADTLIFLQSKHESTEFHSIFIKTLYIHLFLLCFALLNSMN